MGKMTLLGASALRSAAFTSVVALAAATPAFAQDAAPGTTTTAPNGQTACVQGNANYNPNTGTCSAKTDSQLEAASQANSEPSTADGASPRNDEKQEVIVTGTRIRLPNLTNPEPTTSIDFRQVRERNFTNVADAINELPGVRGSITPAGAQGSFGQGVNFVNTYGLGSNRTLSLINGRRFVGSNPATLFNQGSQGTQTDLNVVPNILLDRVDLVSVGGAPIYGSDAISGVVNVILRSKFKGVEFQGTTGITDEGDNFRYNVSALVGGDLFGDRLNLTAAFSRDQVDGVLYNARDYLRANVGGVTNPTLAQATASRLGTISNVDGRLNTNIGFNNSTTDGFPGTVQAINVGIPFLTNGGVITGTNLGGIATNVPCTAATQVRNPASCLGVASPNALAFDTNGNLIPFNQGTLFGANTSAANVGGDGTGVFKFNDFAQITSNLRRNIFNGFLTYKVLDNVELFSEYEFYKSRADELVQQPTFNSSLFGGLSGPVTLSTSSPFLTQQARDALTARGVTNFQVSRASTDIADLTGYNTTKINRGVVGLRGDFTLFGRGMNFEAYANYGKNKATEYGQDINAQNFVNAVNVTTNSAGQVVCTTARTQSAVANAAGALVNGGFASGGLAPIADPNCVPFNPLGNGRASQAARDYIVSNFVTRTEQSQFVVNANVGGSLFDIWGGPVAYNVGYEHREERASFTPSDFQLRGLGRSVAITGLKGEYTLNEAFGEIVLPIFSEKNNIPLLSKLQAFGRGRYVKNTVNGGFFAYTAGAEFAPVRDIEFRGNFTRSFRAPAITELFLPVVNAFNTVPDICSLGTRNAGPAPAIRAANCAAFLARFPNATPDTAATATVPVQSGGNPNLANEQANSYTLGVILRPRFVPRLALTLDYVSITINKPIANLTIAQVASACFDNPSFNAADPANGNSFCSLIRRGADGKVINDPANPAVRTGFVNGNKIKFRGFQGTLDYSVPLRGIHVPGSFGLGGDFLFTRYRLSDITGVAPTRSDGVIGDPAFTAQLRARYANKFWGTNWTMNFVGKQPFSRLNREIGVAGSGPDAREIDALKPYAIFSGGIFADPTDKMRLTLSVTNLLNKKGQNYFGQILPASYVDLLGRRYAISARIRY